MNLGTYDIVIDFDKMFTHTSTNVYFKEGDINTSKIVAKILKNGNSINLEGYNVSIQIETVADNIKDSAKVLDAENGLIEYTFSTNALIEGVNFFEIILVKGDNVKVSPRMAYKVLDSIDEEGSIEAETNYPILINLIKDVNIALNKAKQVTEDAISATDKANEATNATIEVKNEAIEVLDNINKAIASGTQDLEVKEARDGEPTLHVRLERDLRKGKEIVESVEDTFITVKDSVVGNITDIEVLGNTIQGTDLSDIRSVGDLTEDGHYKMSILSTNGLDAKDPKYLENKSSILLPCQLEKVGDVADRLYFDKGEGTWCIDKNVKNSIFKKEDLINNNGHSYQIRNFDMLPKKSWNSVVGTFATVGSGYIQEVGTFDEIKNMQTLVYHLDTNGLMINASIGLYNEMTSNKYLSIKYPTTTPQKIVLPKSVQIQLNSFLDTTHIYTTDTEIEPTIKAKVSKSLGASVESLHNKTDILEDRVTDIEGLKSSQDMKYATDKGYLVCNETQDGVVKDINIKGRTLVNMCPPLIDRYNSVKKDITKPVTVAITCPSDNTSKVYIAYTQTNGNKQYVCIADKGGVSSLYINDIKYITEIYFYGTQPAKYEGYYGAILEGDHTQSPPAYFEGMQSVGEDVDKIEVLSRKEDGNLFDGELMDGMYNTSTGFFEHTNSVVCTNKKTFVVHNQEYEITSPLSGGIYRIFFFKNNVMISSSTTGNSRFIVPFGINMIHCQISKSHMSSEPFQIARIGCLDTPMMHDKKAILYQDKATQEWLPVPSLHEWDLVDSLEGKWYKRSDKVVLNGSEPLWQIANTKEDTICFSCDLKTLGRLAGVLNFINDRFNKVEQYPLQTQLDVEGFSMNTEQNYSDYVYIRINKSKLETKDVAGFKKWLQANNVSVVYQLAQEEVLDITPLNIDVYSNETMISIDGGAVTPGMEFSITSYITNLIQANKERIKNLENDFYSYTVTQNRMQLKSTYSSDSVTFKVDVSAFVEEKIKAELDLDTFNLLKYNIDAGKDNYDYDKMIEMMDFYQLIGKIDWDMWDELWLLMELQHNPPIEVPDEAPEM